MNSGAVLYVVWTESEGDVTDAVANAVTVSLVRYCNGGTDEKAMPDASGRALCVGSALSVGYPPIDSTSSNLAPRRYSPSLRRRES